MQQVTLYTKDSKNKIRKTVFSVEKIENGYKICKKTGLNDGKLIDQPEHVITKGKAKRTIEEQVELEYNSMIKKAKDKGYKDKIEDIGENKTNSEGVMKPMLAESCDKLKVWSGFLSRKLDGVRTLVGLKDGELYTVSRGASNYNAAFTNIFKNYIFEEFFAEYPNLLLDGEAYVHGVSLQNISGNCRLEEYDPERHDSLNYYIYDVVMTDTPFKERLKILNKLQNLLTSITQDTVKIVDHIQITSKEEAWMYHDLYVKEGYEGAILRNGDEVYHPGKRSYKVMAKLKSFTDSEFEIIGYSSGLRDEDFVFKLKTKEGKEFEAKPIGDRKLRAWYLDNIDNLIGKMGTVKYFYLSDDGVPTLPIFKNIRID